MVDVILFVTGILIVILTFIITYMLWGQSKLKSVVANLALQHVKTVEAATIKEFNNCLLVLFTWSFKHCTVGEEGLICELGLVL